MRLISKSKEQPRVIGLTATLLNGNADTRGKAKHAVESLLKTFDANIGHVLDKDVIW